MSLGWSDVDAIAECLYDRFPEVHPLSVRFTDLMGWVLEIEQFGDPSERCGEKVLEAIQMAWLSEYREDHPDDDRYG